MKTIVFDMDGVIFDTERCYLECWNKIGNKYELTNIDFVVRQCIGTNEAKTREIVLNAYGNDFPYDTFLNEVSAYFNEKYGKKIPLKPGVFELLNYLKENNYKIALASSTRKELVEAELKEANLYHYFDCIITGDMVSKSKPEPDIYLKACTALHEKPENCYAIEDSFNGIRSAYSAGLKAIMVPDLLEPNDEMKQISFKICSSLFKVKDYLKKD